MTLGHGSIFLSAALLSKTTNSSGHQAGLEGRPNLTGTPEVSVDHLFRTPTPEVGIADIDDIWELENDQSFGHFSGHSSQTSATIRD